VGNNRGSQTGGQRARIKNYSHDNLLEETKQWAKRQPAKGSTKVYKKRKTLTLCSNLELAVGDGVVVDEDVDE
jgi:hypothetical protein